MSNAATDLLPSINQPMRLLTLTIVLALALPASPALAQVFYDPDDSAGKEYAIPEDDAKRDTSGGKDGGSKSGGDDGPQLFGEGVSGSDGGGASPDDDSSPDGGKSSDDDSSSDDSDEGGGIVSDAGSNGPTASSEAASSDTDDGGTSGALWSLLFVAAVLLIGAGIAFLVRRSRSTPDPQLSR